MFFAFYLLQSMFGLMSFRRFSWCVSTVVILCSVSVGCVNSSPSMCLIGFHSGLLRKGPEERAGKTEGA